MPNVDYNEMGHDALVVALENLDWPGTQYLLAKLIKDLLDCAENHEDRIRQLEKKLAAKVGG